jgi:two-component system CheB/CheR fusion protein
MGKYSGPGSGQPVEPAGDPEQILTHGVPVVGIGASAGGLEAFRLLLANLPADTGVAVVLIQHLDPTHGSGLKEILGRSTKIPISEASDGVTVKPNHIYVIPPNTELTIVDRVLKLSPRSNPPGPHMLIDYFLRSLAQDCRSRAIGVILSGSGSDGSLGLQAVKEAGGITFAQEEATAGFPSMPRMAQEAGCVDFVLPPAEIATELARIAKHPHFEVSQPRGAECSAKEENAGIARILTLVHETTGIDFSLYRETTVQRRVMRRLALRNIRSLEEYLRLLKMEPSERSSLQRDLLISVTSFFRDPGSFEILTKLVFPSIVQNRPADKMIRIWVAGCATGEEAYSIAISLHEYLAETGRALPVQIFASDISEGAIEKARSGKYMENIVADVSFERLKRYFTEIEGGYQISKALRKLCVFSRHNLIDDPPFANLDLISCRNVLIYLGAVRKSILPRFHYALKQNGFLMLGPSETADLDGMFSILDRDHRVYAKKGIAARPSRFYARADMTQNAGTRGIVAQAAVAEIRDEDMGREIDRILLSKSRSAAVLINEGLDVLEVRGEATPFFRLPVGKMSFQLLKLVPDTGLFLEIEKLVREAAHSGKVARGNRVPYESDGILREVNIEVVPISGNQRRALLVFLDPAQKVEEHVGESREKPLSQEEAFASRDRQIAKLKRDVAEARRRLLSAQEEHHASDEESQSTVEEMQSANEELQSLNEELETAKEELQSTNEELITVNQELDLNNAALTEARNFADSVLETIQVPLLTLDRELRIRTVNNSFSKTFLISTAEAAGQHLSSLGGGRWDFAGLRDLLNRVLLANQGQAFDNFEVKGTFPSIGTRDLVINAHRVDHLDVVLVAIDDVTLRKESERSLQKSEEALRQAQKMEAIGRLAGGIAHDFSNLLTVIIGYSHLAANSLGSGNEAAEYIEEVEKAGQRAATLTDQLLAFSRRKVLQPKVFDVNAVVVDFEGMLRRILGEEIKVVFRPGPDLWRVRADPGEIGRALVNLCLNARDAMPAGGTLTIQTENRTIGEAEAGAHNVGAGQYIELDICDTGIGMDQETQTHVFEPFFTTKEPTKGTGLGLATVLGIVELSGGAISFDSELGRGTTFKILLPAIAVLAGQEEHSREGPAEEPNGYSEVILLVEDEEQVRKLASRILQSRGYVVLEAQDGREGLSVCATHQGKIDLLLSDVVMPELGGRELAERIVKMRPDIRVLFISGHTPDVILKEGIKAGTPFLRKPFLPTELAHQVRRVLDSPGLSSWLVGC